MKPPRSTASPSPTTAKALSPIVAEVAPAVPMSGGRVTYTYRLPKKLKVLPLSAVMVPFGPRRVRGIVLELHRRTPRYALKSILSVTTTRLSETQLQFAQWITRTMHGSLGFTLRLSLPSASSKRRSSPVDSGSRQRPHEVLRGPHVPEVKQYLQALKKTDAALIESDLTKRRSLIQNLVAAFTRQTKKSALIVVPEKILLEGWENWPKVQAVVGTQKALFLPFPNLGLIVVEEEAWPTHKLWDQYPRLHNGDAAQALAKIHHARILWSGSFPSVRLHAALKNQSVSALGFQPTPLHPEVHLFSRADYTNKSILPQALLATLRPSLVRKQPTLLLYNSLRADKIKDIRRLLHRAFGKNFSYLTLATTAVFATARPGHFTQAAWLFPESSFTYPDFRSEEHGLVILSRLQQLLPSEEKIHITTRSLTLAQRLLQWQPFDWYDTMLKERRALGYPPFGDAIKLTVSEKNTAKALRRAVQLREILEKRIQASQPSARIQGPFTPLTSDPKKVASEQNLLLLGDAVTLPDLYQDLKIDSVDLSPHRIL